MIGGKSADSEMPRCHFVLNAPIDRSSTAELWRKKNQHIVSNEMAAAIHLVVLHKLCPCSYV